MEFSLRSPLYLDRRIGIPGNQNVVLELHAGCERLMADESVNAIAGIDVPNADGCVQGSADDVFSIELQTVNAICVTLCQRMKIRK